eukprot:6115819-Alexandrium_andersonii.AAC.1
MPRSTLRTPRRLSGQHLTLRIPARPTSRPVATSTFGSSRPQSSPGPISRSWTDGNGLSSAQ